MKTKRPSYWPRRLKILIWLATFWRVGAWMVPRDSGATTVVVAAPFRLDDGVPWGAYGMRHIALCVQPGAVSLAVVGIRLRPGTARLLGWLLEIATGLPLLTVWQR